MKIILAIIISSLSIYFWQEGPLSIFNKQEVHQLEKAIGFAMIGAGSEKQSSHGILVDVNLERKEETKRLYDRLIKKYKKEELTKSNNSKISYLIIKHDKKTSLYFESKGHTDHIKGYTSSIELGISLDLDGKITHISHIYSQETPSYLNKILKSSFLKSFSNIELTKEKQVIDGISGATITSMAIAKSVDYVINEKASLVLNDYLNIRKSPFFSIESKIKYWWPFPLILILLIFLIIKKKEIKLKGMRFQLFFLFTISFIGLYFNNSYTVISALFPFLGRSVGYATTSYSLIILASVIFYKTNIYCRFLCPFGNTQRVLQKLIPLKSKKFFLSNKNISRFRSLLASFIFLGIFLGLESFMSFEPFPDFFAFELENKYFWVALGILSLSFIYPMIWCRLLCPTGAILDGLNKLAKYDFSLKRNIDALKIKYFRASKL